LAGASNLAPGLGGEFGEEIQIRKLLLVLIKTDTYLN